MKDSADHKSDEWTLLREHFHALTREETVEEIFDAQFRVRFGEVIARATRQLPRQHVRDQLQK